MSLQKRVLLWQLTRDFASDGTPREREFFGCSACSWLFANPKNLPQKEQDQVQVDRRFTEHLCKEV
jgi:hypothetical protein